MAKDRTISGFGPTPQSVTNTTGVKAGTWVKFGPFDADKFGAQFVFGTATSGAKAKIQGTVSTAATAVTLVTQTGNLSGSYKHSTYSSGVFSYVRLYSSGKGSTSVTSNAITAHFNALG